MNDHVEDAAAAVEVHEGPAPGAMTLRPETPTSLALPFGSATSALATMSNEEFGARLEAVKLVRDRMREIKRAVLIPGVHYGFPGMTDAKDIAKAAKDGRTGLFKPGAEAICEFFGLAQGDPAITIERGDPENTASPTYVIHARVPIHRGDASGPVVAVGVGAWSTWETKNRFRRQRHACPACGREGLVLQKEAKGGALKGQAVAWCSQRDGGCGAEFLQSDPKIKGQSIGRVTNTEAADLLNTGVKMAKKRGLVDGTISATALSDVFTQDVEDMPPEAFKTNEADVEATVSGMYDGDPDGWRKDVAAGPGEPAGPTAPASRAATPAPGNGVAKPISKAQIDFVLSLAKRKFEDPKRGLDQWLARFNLPAVELLTSVQGARVIADLKTQPDVERAAAPAKTNPEKMPAAQIDRMIQRLKDLLRAREEHGGPGGYRAFDIRDGVWFVVGVDELGHLGILADDIQLDYLTPEQMIDLGTMLSEWAKANIQGDR